MGHNPEGAKEGLESMKANMEIDSYCKTKILNGLHRHGILKVGIFEKFNLPYNKIASAMLVYSDLLEMVAKEKEHLYQLVCQK